MEYLEMRGAVKLKADADKSYEKQNLLMQAISISASRKTF